MGKVDWRQSRIKAHALNCKVWKEIYIPKEIHLILISFQSFVWNLSHWARFLRLHFILANQQSEGVVNGDVEFLQPSADLAENP